MPAAEKEKALPTASAWGAVVESVKASAGAVTLGIGMAAATPGERLSAFCTLLCALLDAVPAVCAGP